jgi:transcriptional regulator with XRE-family HTH domain
MNVIAESLPATLQQVRKARRLSQLELSMRVGVSQRHVSFVESGRAKPSRTLLMTWLQALDAPLVVRNVAMLQAGYAPAYSAAPLGDATLLQANEALLQLLRAHDPMPAMVIDAQWNVLHRNRGAAWLAETLMPWAAPMFDDTQTTVFNLLDLLVHPEGFTRMMSNLHEIGPIVLSHLRSDATAQPTLVPKVEAFADLLHKRIGAQHIHMTSHRPTAPVLTTRFATAQGKLAFFSMFTTFGTPQDITLASLRVEHMFAADEATRAVLFSNLQNNTI